MQKCSSQEVIVWKIVSITKHRSKTKYKAQEIIIYDKKKLNKNMQRKKKKEKKQKKKKNNSEPFNSFNIPISNKDISSVKIVDSIITISSKMHYAIVVYFLVRSSTSLSFYCLFSGSLANISKACLPFA